MVVHFSSIQYILIIFFPFPKLLSDPYSTPHVKFYVHSLTLRRKKKGKSQDNKTNKQTKAKRQKCQNITKHTYENHSIYFVLVNRLLLGMAPTLESGCKRQEVFSGASWVSLPQQVSVESNLLVRVGLCVYFPFPMLDICLICIGQSSSCLSVYSVSGLISVPLPRVEGFEKYISVEPCAP